MGFSISQQILNTFYALAGVFFNSAPHEKPYGEIRMNLCAVNYIQHFEYASFAYFSDDPLYASLYMRK